MKTIFRTNNKTGNFTCLSNFILQSETLTPDEIGVLVRLLSLPENFVINKTSIWKKMNIGRDHFNKVWQKLVEYGYIQTTKTLNKKTKGYEYTHTVHEVPVNQSSVNGSSVHWKSVNGKSVNGKPVSIIIDNKKDPEEKTRKNKILSDPRTGGEGGQGQNKLDQKILGPSNTSKENLQIVPKPSLRYGEFRDNDGGQNKTTSIKEQILEPKVTLSTEVFGSGKNVTSIEVPKKSISNFGFEKKEPKFKDGYLKDFREVIDDYFKYKKLPNWETLLRKKPLQVFLKETSHIHEGIPEIIEMITLLRENLK